MISTLSAIQIHVVQFVPEWLEEDHVERVVPDVEMATALDPGALSTLGAGVIGLGARWLPDSIGGWVWRSFVDQERILERTRNQQLAIRKLADAGAAIVVGSDSPGFPFVPYMFHGPTTIREIELLGEAGFSPMEAIMAATQVPAEMLGLGSKIGTIEVGKQADMVIVEGDPLANLSALRHVLWTIIGGVAQTPEGWVTQ